MIESDKGPQLKNVMIVFPIASSALIYKNNGTPYTLMYTQFGKGRGLPNPLGSHCPITLLR